MDQARYVMAVFALVCYPPAIFFWYLLHPLVRFWRRVGIGVTYTLIVLLMGLAVWALWSFRPTLLGRDLGTSWPLVGIAGLLTQGIYGRVRHPRYAGAALGFIALALFVNFSGVYVGTAYEDYMEAVPCILPLRLPGRRT
jgi:protein-S-isoprenylcysteine O-methyltransferase Ste14